MSVQAICALRVDRLVAADAHLWLWVTNAALHAGHEVMQAWGFIYRSCLTWIKPRLGLGNYLRNQTEHLLLGTRGNAPVLFRAQGTWLYAPQQEHSHKPEEQYAIIGRCSPGPYLAPTSNYSPDANTPAGTCGETTSPATQPYNQKIFGARTHWPGANMTSKALNPRENRSRADGVSIADQIAAVLFSAETEAHLQVTGLPLAPLPPPMPAPSLYCVLTPIDDRGRLADRSPIRAVGWSPGQPITISVVQETVVVISPQPNGAESLTRQGHLRLPAPVRHICRLAAGDRLLVAAAPGPGVLMAYTMPLLESILFTHHLSTPPHEVAP